ncbi:MAG: hypothetical protein ACFFDT_33760 [Candidatus Hodarchaeota archaeon]
MKFQKEFFLFIGFFLIFLLLKPNYSYYKFESNPFKILEEDFNSIDDWEVTNSELMQLNSSIGNPSPSVEVNSNFSDSALCIRTITLPEIQNGEFIRTSVDVYIPEIQYGSISVITGTSRTDYLFPFRIRLYNSNSVHFLIYEKPPNNPELVLFIEFVFNVDVWYNFVVDSYFDHFDLYINGDLISALKSTSYKATTTEIAFGDGSDRVAEQGHYLWDNLLVSKYKSDDGFSTNESNVQISSGFEFISIFALALVLILRKLHH